MPTMLANQCVSGKVSSMTATKSVMGRARKAPGPPSSQAQKTNDRNTTVGEMLSPLLIIIGERTFSARMLTTVTPAMTSKARPTPNSEGQQHRRGHRQHEPHVGHEAQKEGQDAPHQGEVDAEHEQQNGDAEGRDQVQNGAQSELANHALANESQPPDLRVVGPALARSRTMRAGPSASKNNTIIRMRNRLLKKPAMPDRTTPTAPVSALGSTTSRSLRSRAPDGLRGPGWTPASRSVRTSSCRCPR